MRSPVRARRSVTMSFLRSASSAAHEVRDAAPAQVLVDHPQVHVLDRLEARVLHGLERQAMLLADRIAVVAVDQNVAPQHQRIAAAFGEDAALEGFVFLGREGIDIGFEFFVDDDVHAGRGGSEGRNSGGAAGSSWMASACLGFGRSNV